MKNPRIIICRHAESIEDVNKDIYATLDDLQIPLTEKGAAQAANFGSVLAQLLGENNSVRFYTSPGVRNMQTLKIVLPKLSDRLNIQVEIEPLIVKQDWGKIDLADRDRIENERYKTGVLRYTFPNGESAGNMISRLAKFRDKIFKVQQEVGDDVVLFSHGFEFRVFLMLVFGWSEEYFESFGNIANCEYRILTLETTGTYVLDRPLRKHGLPITRLLEKSKK